jgi:hypothetical protein
MNCNKEEAFIICIGVSLFCLVVGFGAAEIGISANGNKEKSSSGTCPHIDPVSQNITYYELKKDLSFSGLLWRWEYNGPLGAHQVTLRQACPSLQHDVLMYIDGGLASRTDGKLLSTTSQINVFDCHQQQLYTITTGSFWITLLNTNRIQVSFHLQDMKGNTLLYVAGTNIFTLMTHYSFMDVNGIEVAYADKDITTFPWTWKVHLRQLNSSVLDIRVLSLVFSHASFSEGGSDSNGNYKDTTDSCNGFFFWNGVAWGCFTFLVLCLSCWFFYETIKGCCQWCKSKDWKGDYGNCLTSCKNVCLLCNCCCKKSYSGSTSIDIHINQHYVNEPQFTHTNLPSVVKSQYSRHEEILSPQ